MSAASIPGPPPLLLRALPVAAAVAAGCGLLLPGHAGAVAGWTAVALVVAGPALRIALAARDWRGRGDRPYVGAAVALLLLLGAVAFLGR